MLTLLIGLIVISFMFSDYQMGGGGGTSDKIGEVGNLPLKFKEYQSEYNRNIRLYSQYFGQGKPLGSKQIRALNIKDKSISALVEKKTHDETWRRHWCFRQPRRSQRRN